MNVKAAKTNTTVCFIPYGQFKKTRQIQMLFYEHASTKDGHIAHLLYMLCLIIIKVSEVFITEQCHKTFLMHKKELQTQTNASLILKL